MRGYHSREDTDLVNMVGKIVLWKMWVTILCPSAELAFLNISVSFLELELRSTQHLDK